MFIDEMDYQEHKLASLARNQPEVYNKLWEDGSNPYLYDFSWIYQLMSRMLEIIKDSWCRVFMFFRRK